MQNETTSDNQAQTQSQDDAQEISASAETQQDETLEASEASSAKDGKELSKDGEDQADEQAEESKGEPKAKKPGFVKRIDKLTKRLSERERELEYWREQAMKGHSSKPTESRSETTLEATGKPKSDEFETHEAWIEAVAEWTFEQKLKAQEAKQREDSLKSEFQKQQEQYVSKAKAFAKETPDFEEVIAEAGDVELSITVQNAILKHGPELAYELAKDVDALEEICALPALEAAERIGEIRAQMKRAPKKTEESKPKLSSAPKPPTPIAAKTAPVRKSVYDEELSFSDFERLRREQLRRKA